MTSDRLREGDLEVRKLPEEAEIDDLHRFHTSRCGKAHLQKPVLRILSEGVDDGIRKRLRGDAPLPHPNGADLRDRKITTHL